MRKVFASAAVFICSLTVLMMVLICPVYAENIRQTNEDTSYTAIIEDDARILKDTAAILDSMIPVTEYGNVVLKTISENSTSADTFAEQYLHNSFGTKSATVFLIDMANRKIYIFSDGAIYKTITNAKAEVITDNVYRYASSGDYDNCAIRAFGQMQKLLEGGRIAEPMHIAGIALISLLLGMIICFIIIWTTTKKKPAKARELIEGTDTSIGISEPEVSFYKTVKTYDPVSKGGGIIGGSGGSGGVGGGGFSGGGFGGGVR